MLIRAHMGRDRTKQGFVSWDGREFLLYTSLLVRQVQFIIRYYGPHTSSRTTAYVRNMVDQWTQKFIYGVSGGKEGKRKIST